MENKEAVSFFAFQKRYFQQMKYLFFCLCGVLLCLISQFRVLNRWHDSHNPPIDTHQHLIEHGETAAEGLVSSRGTHRPTSYNTLPEEVQPHKTSAEGSIPDSTMRRHLVSSSHHERPPPNSINTLSSTNINTLPRVQPQQRKQQSIAVKNAIVHVGPYKTGSSTIQAYSNKLKNQLLKDGYDMPYSHQFANGTRLTKPWVNQVQFATCFYHNAQPARLAERKVYPCRDDLLESGLDIGQKHNHSIFLSAESFSALEEEGIATLRDYLHPTWNNITIIAYYRRYYDWILSFHNEVARGIMTKDPWHIFEKNSTDLLGASLVNDLTSNIDLLEDMHHKYTLNVIPRYKKYFSNVVVVNMHDTKIPEHFYCVLMPHAENTCKALRHMLSLGQFDANRSSQNIVYLELAYAAHRKGIFHVQTKDHCANVIDAMQGYQEKMLNLTVADFPRRCLPSEVLDRMWNTSVQAEKEFGNALSANDGDHDGRGGPLAALRDDFEKFSKSRLCEVDFDAILGTLVWREFFAKHVPIFDRLTKTTLIRNKDLVGTSSED